MPNVVTNGGDEKRQSFEGSDERSHWGFFRDWWGFAPRRVGRESTDVYQEIESGLQYIHHMAEIVIRDKTVICSTASNEKAD
jgi:hypothetical protein